MVTLGDKIMPKLCSKFSCKNCDYNTDKKSSYDNHLKSLKHQFSKNGLQMGQNYAEIMPSSFICPCGKQYQHRQGLWRHKKICKIQQDNNDIYNPQLHQKQLVDYLLKENSEFKHMMLDQNKQMIELAKNSGNNNNNNNNNTNSNNSFNLQFFLNDTCKNAMNIMDFVSQLQVNIKDLEETGRLGFAEGISKIFINGLNQMNISDRPIHCSDFKRETLYIKNNNEWAQEKATLTNAIKHVAHKNIKQITEWTKDHPEYNDPDSKENDKYLQIVSESMSGSTKEETNKNYNKIIKNIAKETVIDK